LQDLLTKTAVEQEKECIAMSAMLDAEEKVEAGVGVTLPPRAEKYLNAFYGRVAELVMKHDADLRRRMKEAMDR
jgi:hypothetical protein